VNNSHDRRVKEENFVKIFFEDRKMCKRIFLNIFCCCVFLSCSTRRIKHGNKQQKEK
jgi:hypothetical protein